MTVFLLATITIASPQAAERLDTRFREWLVAGPVPVISDSARVARDYLTGEESLIAPTHGSSDGGLEWQLGEADEEGWLDFERWFGWTTEHAAAYAAQYVYSPDDATYVLRLRSDADVVPYLNGRRREPARGAPQLDEGEARVVGLHDGWNLLLLEVINRSGSYRVLARLEAWPPNGPGGQLRFSAIRPRDFELRQPRPSVVVESVALGPRLRIGWQGLYGVLTVSARAWGEVVSEHVWIGLSAVPAAAAPPALNRIDPLTREGTAPIGPGSKEAATLEIGVPFARLSAVSRDGTPITAVAAPGTGGVPDLAAAGPAGEDYTASGRTELTYTLEPGELLDRLSEPIDFMHVRYLPRGAPETAWLDPHDRRWLRAPPRDIGEVAALGIVFPIPLELDGLSLELDAGGVAAAVSGPIRVLVNGTEADGAAARPGATRALLCTACSRGDTTSVAVVLPPGGVADAGGSRAGGWAGFELPVLRVREPGYAEIARSLRAWSANRTAGMEVSDRDRRILLASLESPGKETYRSLLAGYRAIYAGDAAMLRGDTVRAIGEVLVDGPWFQSASLGSPRLRDAWTSVLELSRRFPTLVFTHSSAQHYSWLEEHAPDQLARVQRAIRMGQWVPVGGWWTDADHNVPSGESLVRQGLYGQRYLKARFGLYAQVAWGPPDLGSPPTLPQILRGQGLAFFVARARAPGALSVTPTDLFRWEAPDGTRVLAYAPLGFEPNVAPERLAWELREHSERNSGLSQAMTVYRAAEIGPDAHPLRDRLEAWEAIRRVETVPALVHASPDEALARIRASRSEFDTWRGALSSARDDDALSTRADVRKLNRDLEVKLETAEKLAVAADMPYPYATLESAWKQLLASQSHGILAGGSAPDVYDQVHERLDVAERMLDDVIARAGRALGLAAAPGTFTVFNPVSSARGGRVEIPARALAELDAPATYVTDERGDHYTIETDEAGRPFLFAPEIPGLGFRTFRARADAATGRAGAGQTVLDASSIHIENDVVSVGFSASTGEITSIFDKRNRREVLPAGARANQLQVFGSRPQMVGMGNPRRAVEPDSVRDVTRFATRADATAARAFVGRRFGQSQVEQTFVLRPGSPLLEIEHFVDWRDPRTLVKLAFPMAVSADSVTFEVPYGVVRRSTNPPLVGGIPSDVLGQRWVDLSSPSQRYGVSILNDGKYEYDVHGNVIRVTLLRLPWNLEAMGARTVHRFRLAIFPHAGSWEDARTPQRAAELNTPLVSFYGAPMNPQPLASLDVDHVAITTVKRAEDDPGALVFRLVELIGRGASARLTVREPPTQAHEADLLERAADAPLPTDGADIFLSFRPWEIKTVIVRW